jgi:hypothetical protein
MAMSEIEVSIIGYFYAVDFGPGVRPQHHRVGSNGVCSCYLAEKFARKHAIQPAISVPDLQTVECW